MFGEGLLRIYDKFGDADCVDLKKVKFIPNTISDDNSTTFPLILDLIKQGRFEEVSQIKGGLIIHNSKGG